MLNTWKAAGRIPLMSVGDMTDKGQWVVHGPNRAGFAYYPGERRRIDFQKDPGGWDLTLEFEALQTANRKIFHFMKNCLKKKMSPCEKK